MKYCPNRKFSTVEEHDEHLIRVWNEKVDPKDTIFTLGDFAFGPVENSYTILDRLNGKKILITGNHDMRHIKSEDFRKRFAAVKYGYHEVEVSFKGHTKLIVLCHFPLQSWNKDRYGSAHFFGHVHQNKPRLMLPHMANVGVDSREDHAPWGKDELLNLLFEE